MCDSLQIYHPKVLQLDNSLEFLWSQVAYDGASDLTSAWLIDQKNVNIDIESKITRVCSNFCVRNELISPKQEERVNVDSVW